MRFELPSTLPPGRYGFDATFKFSNGETQTDAFAITVLAPPQMVPKIPKAALFDPKGETAALLKQVGFETQLVEATSDLSSFDLLIIGKSALTPPSAAPDITRVRQGLKVILFEQTAEVMEKRFGFRVAEYGLRQVFPRIPDSPILHGLTSDNLRDWGGDATILPPRLKYELNRKFNGAPTVQWCDMPVTRLWRCGNRGNVASVLLEKPVRGDFLPIIDGGYSLQYSPLLEYREGQGMVLFCQMDVTGRTESDPAADLLVRNILRYVAAWKPVSRRKRSLRRRPSRQELSRIRRHTPPLFRPGQARPRSSPRSGSTRGPSFRSKCGNHH